MEVNLKKNHKMWLESFLENCRIQNRSHNTLINYHSDLERFLAWYESAHASLISATRGDTISKYKEFLSKGGTIFRPKKTFFRKIFTKSKKEKIFDQTPLSINSQKRHLSAVKNFFEFLKQSHEDRSKLFQINPVKTKIHGIRLKEVDVEHTKLLSPDDWKKIDKHLFRISDRLMYWLLYYGGLRLDELCNLQVKHFNTENGTITFPRKGGYLHTLKVQRPRTIFNYFERTVEHKKLNGESYLFGLKNGKRVSNKTMYNRIMKTFLNANCERGISPHSFRKACATNIYKRTRDLLFVRDYLNHSDAKVTQTYIEI